MFSLNTNHYAVRPLDCPQQASLAANWEHWDADSSMEILLYMGSFSKRPL